MTDGPYRPDVSVDRIVHRIQRKVDVMSRSTKTTDPRDSTEHSARTAAATFAESPEFARRLAYQMEGEAALDRGLRQLEVEVTAEQAYRAQATEHVWRQIDREFGLLTSEQVAEVAGSTARHGGSYASDARRDGRLMGVARLNRMHYPGFQLDSSGPLPVIRQLRQAADRLEVGERTVLLWMVAPTTWWGDDSRPVDHLHDRSGDRFARDASAEEISRLDEGAKTPERADGAAEILQAFGAHFGPIP